MQLAAQLLRHLTAALTKAGASQAPTLALALSGGPDSVALASLLSRWAAQRGPLQPTLLAFVVDHALRPDSAAEAAGAASLATALGLQPHVLRIDWPGGEPPRLGRKMEAARDARYMLMAEYAAALGAQCLLTAHHADDQAETVLLRAARASGVEGLAGMADASRLHYGDGSATMPLLRPLLRIPKCVLVSYCEAQRLPFARDPTNFDTRFARNHARALLSGACECAAGLRGSDGEDASAPCWELGQAQARDTGAWARGVNSANEAADGAWPWGACHNPRRWVVRDLLRVQAVAARTAALLQSRACAALLAALVGAAGVRQLVNQGRAVPDWAAPAAVGGEDSASARKGRAQCEAEGAGPQTAPPQEPCTQHLARNHVRSMKGRGALLAAAPLAAAGEAAATRALAAVLQEVSGAEHAMPLRQQHALWRRLRGGALQGGFTGGGCRIRPLVGTRGTLLVIEAL